MLKEVEHPDSITTAIQHELCGYRLGSGRGHDVLSLLRKGRRYEQQGEEEGFYHCPKASNLFVDVPSFSGSDSYPV
jgi:hypothetical protein